MGRRRSVDLSRIDRLPPHSIEAEQGVLGCALLEPSESVGQCIERLKGGGEAFESPLRGFDQVILTPHVGGSTLEAQQNIGLEVAGKLLRYSNNGSTLSAVNFPEVSLPEHPDQQRLLHIHRNQPGVLSEINHIFSEYRINIVGQYLRTDPQIGYVVMDIESAERKRSLQLKKRLEGIAGTIRARILF